MSVTAEKTKEEKVVDLCVSALLCDGGHHKQWYLERILLELVGKDGVDEIRAREQDNDYEWEEGIPP